MSADLVTVVVVATDEEGRIGATLAAARDASFPVTVVDGGSTDRTVELAHQHRCRVVERPFDCYSAQRNFGLAQVSTDYVLFVDADELVTPELAREVRRAAGRGVDGAWVPTMDYFAGRWMTAGGWFPQPHVRLVRRAAVRFEGAVHERVVFSVPHPLVVELATPLLHLSHLTLSHYIAKLNTYTSIEARERKGRPALLVLRGLAEAAAVIGRRLVVQRGWRDGIHGVVGAFAYAFYRFTIYAKAATASPLDAPTPDGARRRGQDA